MWLGLKLRHWLLSTGEKVAGNFACILEWRQSCRELRVHSRMASKLPATSSAYRNAEIVAGNFVRISR